MMIGVISLGVSLILWIIFSIIDAMIKSHKSGNKKADILQKILLTLTIASTVCGLVGLFWWDMKEPYDPDYITIKKIQAIKFYQTSTGMGGDPYVMSCINEDGESYTVNLKKGYVFRDEDIDASYYLIDYSNLTSLSTDQVYLTAETYDKYKDEIERYRYKLVK